MRDLLFAIGTAISIAIAAPAASAQPATLAEGTKVSLATRSAISSKTAHVGDAVELAVAEPVQIDGTTVIPAGTRAVGEVTRVKGSGLLGRSGKIDIKVTGISVDGKQVPVRGQQNAKGRSGTIGAVGAGVVFLPLAIVVKGKSARIPEGTVFDVFVDQDVQLGPVSAPAPPVAGPPPSN